MNRYGLVLAGLFVAVGAARAASPNPDDLLPTPEVQVKARALVAQLGSDDFAAREDAQEQLAALGRLARPALAAGAVGPDPEVRHRCNQLLPAARALDLKAKLETFLADVNGEYEHDFPGWKTFRAVVRSQWTVCGRVVWTDRALDRAAREVFGEMLASAANRRVLVAVDSSRVDLTDIVLDRRAELAPIRGVGARRFDDVPLRGPTLEDVTALLFGESRIGSQYMLRQPSAVTLMSTSGFTRAARGTDPKAKVYRAVAAAWLDSRNDPREMYTALNVATELDLNDQLCGLAARLLTMPGVTSLYRSRAASTLAQYGGKKHVPLLAKALTDTVVVTGVARPVPFPRAPGGADPAPPEIQVRDLALAVSVQLSGQKLADYGFSDRRGGDPYYNGDPYVYSRHYFADDEARKAALAKWAAWRKAHPDE